MKEKEKHETVAELAALLRHTTQKRFVIDPSLTSNMKLNGSPIEPCRIPSTIERSYQSLISGPEEEIELEVEYHNILFTPEETEMIKRKFLKLVDQL